MTNYHIWPEISSCLKEAEEEKSRLTKSTINLDTLTSVREKIAKQIEQLQLSFEQELDKHFASLAIFALVSYIDEKVQKHVLETGLGNWAPLQKDFYGAYNAGELFYETIDKIIDDPQTPPMVLQVYYFILKKGFRGKYRDSKTHVEKYLNILKEKIPVTHPKKLKENTESAFPTNKRKLKAWHYYAGTGVLAVGLLTILYTTSSLG